MSKPFRKPLAALLVVAISSTLMFSGCSTMPGDGGTSTIQGKVFQNEYNTSNIIWAQYYVGEQRVYLIYGDGTTYDDETKTSYDGSYVFHFLRKGDYKVFVYSDCPTCQGGTEPVIANATISDNHQVVNVPDIVIEKHD